MLWTLSGIIAVASVCAPYAAYQAKFPSILETSFYYALARPGMNEWILLMYPFTNSFSPSLVLVHRMGDLRLWDGERRSSYGIPLLVLLQSVVQPVLPGLPRPSHPHVVPHGTNPGEDLLWTL